MNDWTPEGSMAKSRHIYPQFVAFIKESIDELRENGHAVELAGVFLSCRRERDVDAPLPEERTRVAAVDGRAESEGPRDMPALKWYVSAAAADG